MLYVTVHLDMGVTKNEDSTLDAQILNEWEEGGGRTLSRRDVLQGIFVQRKEGDTVV